MSATLAIVLRRSKLTETSLIITWLTEESGRVRTVAKGARKPGSPFFGKVDLFFESEILFARSRRSDLHPLRETRMIQPHEPIRENMLKLQTACYFVELLELITEADYPVPELFDLFRRALTYLDTTVPTGKSVEHFEREIVRLAGITSPENAPRPASAVRDIARGFGKIPRSREVLIRALG